MDFNQGDRYNPPKDEPVEVDAVVNAADDDSFDEERVIGEKHFPLPLIIVGAALIVIAVVLAIIFLPRFYDKEPVPDPAVSTDPGIVEGDSSYWEQYEVPFSYTPEQLVQLRAWGYTGTEIEENEGASVPASTLILEAQRVQEAALATLSNPESPEYKALLDSTWLGQPRLILPDYVQGTTDAQIFYNTHMYNADFEKIEPHGKNLYLKVYIEDGSAVFMECPLIRYMQLPTSGNIVVSYNTATLNDVTVVYGMTEVVV